MTFTRATTVVGLASVLVAWLAGAAVLSVNSAPATPPARRVEPASTQALADEVQAQASRLRDRMAVAPAPNTPTRNPFAFAPHAEPASRTTRVAAVVTPSPAAPLPGEPPLQLVGVAERETAKGIVRTAMITADSDELFMLVDGETLGARYRVVRVGEEVVELSDLVTGATRRLSLR